MQRQHTRLFAAVTLLPLASGALTIAGGSATPFTSELDGRFIGHPTLPTPMQAGGAANGGAPPVAPAPDDPPDSPLATGSFVNFESPPIEPLAFDAAGNRLYAANTPNNSLVVLDASGAELTAQQHALGHQCFQRRLHHPAR